MRYLSQWAYRITTVTFSDVLILVSMCSIPCVREYFQLCQSVTTQILLGRKGVVHLNYFLGFGSTELKLTECVNSVFFVDIT